MSDEREPVIGDTVIYRAFDGVDRPAKVTAVHRNEGGVVRQVDVAFSIEVGAHMVLPGTLDGTWKWPADG